MKSAFFWDFSWKLLWFIYNIFFIRIQFIKITRFRFQNSFKNHNEAQILLHFFVFMTMVPPPFFKASFLGNLKCVLNIKLFLFRLPSAIFLYLATRIYAYIFFLLCKDLVQPSRFSKVWNHTILPVPLVSLLQQNKDLFWNYYLRIIQELYKAQNGRGKKVRLL